MLRATRDAVRRAASSSRATSTRRGMSAGGAAKKPLDGRRQAEEMTPEQIEELSVFNAAGGLVGAAVGGIGVFVIGAAATLGVASGAASLLGASRIRSTPESATDASGGARRAVSPGTPGREPLRFPDAPPDGPEPSRTAEPEPTLRSPSPPLAGHSMSSKSVPGDARAPPPTRADLQAELDALRRQPRSERVDAAKKDLKKKLKAANA